MDLQLKHEIEQLRRSVAMLPPGQQALDREAALDVLQHLQLVSRRVHRLEGGMRALLDDDERAHIRGHPSGWTG